MADSAVVITSGTGTNIDTRTEGTNGNHRQVVVLGDPATNTGVAPVDATNGLAVDVKQSALPTGASTSAKQDTGNTSLGSIDTKLTDVATQTTLALIKAKTDNLDTALSGIKTGTDKIISAPATAAKQPALGTAGTASTDVLTVQGITSMTPLKVDGSGVTQPVSGTFWQTTQPVSLTSVPSHAVTNDGTFATQATLQAGTAYAGKVRLTDGTTDAEVIPLTNYNAQAVAMVDGNGDQITSFGGGTEYTEAGTPPTHPIGKVLVFDNGGAWQDVDSTHGFPIEIKAGNPTSITANAGTNLNTSLLALESGGNLATIAGKDFATQTTLSAINTKLVSGTDIGDVTINNASGASAVNIQDGGNAITVDYATTGSGTATGALRVELPTNGTGVVGLNAGTNNIGDVDVLTVPADPFGVNADAASATTSISAKLKGIATALGVTALDLGSGTGGTRTLRYFQDTAQFVGGTGTDTSATQRVSLATNVALPAGTNTLGAVKSVPSDIDINGSNANHADKYYTNAGAVTDGIVWSPAAGKRWHILTLYINVSAASTITLEDDLAGGDVARWKGELAANSGVVLTYDKEHPFCSGEDAADLIITTTAGNVYVQAVGYEI